MRDHVLIGRERNDVGRPHDWGYPIRGIVQGGLLYLNNFEPSRWPAGNPETGYLDVDGSPTKTEIIQTRTDPRRRQFWQWSFGKRDSEEMFDVAKDPACMVDLIARPEYRQQRESLREQLLGELRRQQDPRMFGQGHVFDDYPYSEASLRGFYERYLKGEKLRANWVNPSDFEKGPVEEK